MSLDKADKALRPIELRIKIEINNKVTSIQVKEKSSFKTFLSKSIVTSRAHVETKNQQMFNINFNLRSFIKIQTF